MLIQKVVEFLNFTGNMSSISSHACQLNVKRNDKKRKVNEIVSKMDESKLDNAL